MRISLHATSAQTYTNMFCATACAHVYIAQVCVITVTAHCGIFQSSAPATTQHDVYPVYVIATNISHIYCLRYRANDPSAGSPTETLLRLLLPLSDKVYLTFRGTARSRAQSERFTGPLEIGRSDGRCVQRAGT